MAGMQEAGCPAHATEAGVPVVKEYRSRELCAGRQGPRLFPRPAGPG